MANEATQDAYQEPVRKVVFTKLYNIEGKQRVFVVPPTVHLGGKNPAKSIRWVNETGDLVKIWLTSPRDLLKSSEDLSKPIEIPRNGELVVAVNDGLEELGECSHHYHVYCEAVKNYAEGNSPPNMSCP